MRGNNFFKDMKSYLSIDYGFARIGLAISESGLLARPLMTIQNRGARKNFAAIAKVTQQFKTECIVIGLPVHKNTDMSDNVREFAETLKPLGLEIEFQNEMLTSVAAGEICNDKKLLDSYAAAVILNDYIKENNKNVIPN